MSEQPFDIDTGVGDEADTGTATEGQFADLWASVSNDAGGEAPFELLLGEDGLLVWQEGSGEEGTVWDSSLWDQGSESSYADDDYGYAWDDSSAWDLTYDFAYESDAGLWDDSLYGDYGDYYQHGVDDWSVDDWSYWEGESYFESSGDGWYAEGDYTMLNMDGDVGMFGPGTTGEDLVHDMSDTSFTM